jgi:RimJ/RimL family protein N-acetyltransferase
MYKSNRIRLRPIEESDAPLIAEMRSDFEDVRAYIGRPFPNHVEGEREWIRGLYQKGFPTSIAMVVEELESKAFIGFVVASQIHWVHRTAAYGVFLHRNARGKGYFREAQILFFAYLFRELNLRKLNSSIIPYNQVAIKVTTSLGFKQDGLRKEQIFQNGKYYDEMTISLMASDFFASNPVDEIVV